MAAALAEAYGRFPDDPSTDAADRPPMADPTLSTLQRACRDSWRAGYQTAVDTLRDMAREYGAEDMKLTIAALADALQSVKPGEETADG